MAAARRLFAITSSDHMTATCGRCGRLIIASPIERDSPWSAMMTIFRYDALEWNVTMKFRKKPVEVEAWENVPGATVPGWFQCKGGCEPGASIKIATLEGIMTAAPGDWIIKGVKGEIYPCKPDIFAATYDRVGDRSTCR